MSVPTGGALIDTKAAAAYLCVAPITLVKLRIRGSGPRFVRLTPRAIRYRPEDLRHWVNERNYSGTSEYSPREAAS